MMVELDDPVENIGAKLVSWCQTHFRSLSTDPLAQEKGRLSAGDVEKEVTKIRNSGTRTKTKMSNGGKFELGVASKGKRLCVTTNEGSSYQGIVETVLFMEQCCCFVTTQCTIFFNTDPVENIGAKLVPAGNPMDKGSLDESS
ncbi:hypothetical protein Bca52824_018764 [Brassica carinata]|uniref:Uncharacterized protein n=1 Tax=Brassica carinata TaxID=52824 RepID=A0A8X8AZS2_BRACI|nr:hypothetical protein Bca52824_018764 [Brassica carinata]